MCISEGRRGQASMPHPNNIKQLRKQEEGNERLKHTCGEVQFNFGNTDPNLDIASRICASNAGKAYFFEGASESESESGAPDSSSESDSSVKAELQDSISTTRRGIGRMAHTFLPSLLATLHYLLRGTLETLHSEA